MSREHAELLKPVPISLKRVITDPAASYSLGYCRHGGTGKRTADRKLQAAEALAMSPELAESAGFGLLSHAGDSQLNASLTWEDLKWIKSEWDGPVVLKGVQTAEDAARAADLGVDGVLLSNHGGRQMHDAPDALTTLLEIRTYYPAVLDKLEIFLDGGCRDGADVLKAVCLGAKAVGVGRPFFYALAAYGEKGIERCSDSESCPCFSSCLISIYMCTAPNLAISWRPWSRSC